MQPSEGIYFLFMINFISMMLDLFLFTLSCRLTERPISFAVPIEVQPTQEEVQPVSEPAQSTSELTQSAPVVTESAPEVTYEPTSQPKTEPLTSNSDTVVVYYSRSGVTKSVAEYLAKRFNWSIIDIQEVKHRGTSRFNLWSYLVAGYESVTKKLSPIQPVNIDWANIKFVVIGTPVWSGGMATPIRTFFSEQLPKTAQYGILYTCEFGSSHDKVQKNISDEATQLMDGHAPLVILGVSSSDVKKGEPTYDAKLKLENINVA